MEVEEGGLLLYSKEHSRLSKVCGVEISNTAIEFFARKGIGIFKTLDMCAGRKFDLITAIDVIEHVPHPKEFLLSLRDRLNTGGKVFLRLPVIDGMLFDRKRPEEWKWVYAPYHVSMFSIKALKQLCAATGFNCHIVMDKEVHAHFGHFLMRFIPRYERIPLILIRLLRVPYLLFVPILRRIWPSECVYATLEPIDR